MSNPANDPKPVALSRKGFRALLGYCALSALAAGMLAWCAAGDHTETQAEALARCQRTAAMGGHLAAIDADHLPAWFSRDQLAALPEGYSRLPNGEGVIVSRGCAFVETPR